MQKSVDRKTQLRISGLTERDAADLVKLQLTEKQLFENFFSSNVCNLTILGCHGVRNMTEPKLVILG